MKPFERFELLFEKDNYYDSFKEEPTSVRQRVNDSMLFEPLEPRVMLAADMAALNALAASSYLEDLDKYVEDSVLTQEFVLINDNLKDEAPVRDFISDIDAALASFSLDNSELSIQGFRNEIDSLFPSGDDGVDVGVLVIGDENSSSLTFQLNFIYSYQTKFDAQFEIDTEAFKLVTMIGNTLDGSTVKDMVDVDISMGLSYSFTITENIADDTTTFNVNPLISNSLGFGGAFSLDYKAVLNDDFSAIGQVGGMAALIYEKDNTSYDVADGVGMDSDLMLDGEAVSTVDQLVDLAKNHRPDGKSSAELMFDFNADNDVTSESKASGRIVSSTGIYGSQFDVLSFYNVVYDNATDSVDVAESEVSAELFITNSLSTLVNEDVDIYLYAKTSLVPELDEWAPELNLDADWLDDSLDSFIAFPELRIETPIFIYAGSTAEAVNSADDTEYTSELLDIDSPEAFQGYEVLFAPSLLDVGMFWGGMVDSMIGQVREILEPAMPAIDLLLSPIPGLSELTEMVGWGEVRTVDMLSLIADIYSIEDKGRAADAMSILIPALEFIDFIYDGALPADADTGEVDLGDVKVGVVTLKDDGDDSESNDGEDKLKKAATADDDTKESEKLKDAEEKTRGKTVEKETTKDAEFDFNMETPLFSDPESFIYGMMSGDMSTTLFSLDLSLEMSIGMDVKIPFLTIGVVQLALRVMPEFSVGFNIGAGFDLVGVNSFLNRLDWDTANGATLDSLKSSVEQHAGLIMEEGFYFDDHYDEDEGEDGKEFTVGLGITLGLFAEVPKLGPVTISVGVSGGLTFEFGIDLNDMPNKLPVYQWRDPVEGEGMLYKYDADPNNWEVDHHIHLNEFDEMRSVKNMFTLSMEISFAASLSVEVGLNLAIAEITLLDWELTLFEITLFDIALSSPASHYDIIANTEYVPPTLAGWQDKDNGVVELYVGDKATSRANSTQDGTARDTLTNEKYYIRSLGYTKIADGDNFASGTMLEDTYGEDDLGYGETIEISFNGGTQIIHNVREIVGDSGSGDDKIQVRGNGRHETEISVFLSGGAGNDILSYTGIGAARIKGDEGDDKIAGGSGNDLLYGGGGNDKLYGNAGNDGIYGDTAIYDIDNDMVFDYLEPGAVDGDQISAIESGYDRIDGGLGVDYVDGGDGGYVSVVDSDDWDGDGDTTELRVTGEYRGDEYSWEYGDGEDTIADSGSSEKDNDQFVINGSTSREGAKTIQQADTVDVRKDTGSDKLVVDMRQSWDVNKYPAQTVLKMDGIEELVLGVNGGGDIVNVYDYKDTDLEYLSLGLNAKKYSDGGAQFNIFGTDGNDQIKAYALTETVVGEDDEEVSVDSFWVNPHASSETFIMGVTTSDAAEDTFNIYSLGGNDTISVESSDDAIVSDMLALGVIDAGDGDNTITVDGVVGRGDGFKIIGGSGGDNITVKNSSNFSIETGAAEPIYETDSDNIVTNRNWNTVSVLYSLNFTVSGGEDQDEFIGTDIAAFAIDLKEGFSSIEFNDKAISGTVTTGGDSKVEGYDLDGDIGYDIYGVILNLGAFGEGSIVKLEDASDVVINTTDKDDTIKVVRGERVFVNSFGGDDKIEITNLKDSIVRGGDGDDTVEGYALRQGSNVSIYGEGGADEINMRDSTGYSVYGGGGKDEFFLGFGQGYVDAGADDGSAGDVVVVNTEDSILNQYRTVELLLDGLILKSEDTLFGEPAEMIFANIDQLSIVLNKEADDLGLHNIVTVEGLAVDTYISGDKGNDKFIVRTESLDNNLTIDGDLGSDRLSVEYSGSGSGGELHSGVIKRSGMRDINFSSIEVTDIELTGADDVYTVYSTGNISNIYAGKGDDTVYVNGAAGGVNVYGGTRDDVNKAGFGDADRVVIQVTDGLGATTFGDVGVTAETLEVKNAGSLEREFTLREGVIYSAKDNGYKLVDLTAALGAGLVESILVTGQSSDKLTVDRSGYTDGVSAVIEDSSITLDDQERLDILQSDAAEQIDGLDINIFNGFTLEVDGNTYYYYRDAEDKTNEGWAYSYVSSEDYNTIVKNELINSLKVKYVDATGEQSSLYIYDRDGDGYYDIDSSDRMYALMRSGDLALMSQKYELKGDIDLTGYEECSPIGLACNAGYGGLFTGEFKGNGHRISGLKYEGRSYGGLFFGLGDGAVVENFELVNTQISVGAGNFAGAVVGFIGSGDVRISRVSVTAESASAFVSSETAGYAGGLVGFVDQSLEGGSLLIEDCLVKGVSAGSGLIAAIKGGNVELNHCRVENVWADTGAGLFNIAELSRTNSHLTVKDCEVIDSKVRYGGWGTLIATGAGSVVEVDNVVVKEDVAANSQEITQRRGLFDSLALSLSTATISNIDIELKGMESGMGRSVSVAKLSTLTVKNCTINATSSSDIEAGLFEEVTVDNRGGAYDIFKASMVIDSVRVAFADSSTAENVSGLIRDVRMYGLRMQGYLDTSAELVINDIYVSGDLSGSSEIDEATHDLLKGGSGLIDSLITEGNSDVVISDVMVRNAEVDGAKVAYGLMREVKVGAAGKVWLSEISVKGEVIRVGGIYNLHVEHEYAFPGRTSEFNATNVMIEINGDSGMATQVVNNEHVGNLSGFINHAYIQHNMSLDKITVYIDVESDPNNVKAELDVTGLINRLVVEKGVATINGCNIKLHENVDNVLTLGDKSAAVGGDWDIQNGGNLFFRNAFIDGKCNCQLVYDLRVGPEELQYEPSLVYLKSYAAFYNSVFSGEAASGNTCIVSNKIVAPDDTSYYGLIFTHLDFDGMQSTKGVHQVSNALYNTNSAVGHVWDAGHLDSDYRLYDPNIVYSSYDPSDLRYQHGGTYNQLLIDSIKAMNNVTSNGFIYPNKVLEESDIAPYMLNAGFNHLVFPSDAAVGTNGYIGSTLAADYGVVEVADTGTVPQDMTGGIEFVTAVTTGSGKSFAYGKSESGNGLVWYEVKADGSLDASSVGALSYSGFTVCKIEASADGKYLITTTRPEGTAYEFVNAYKIDQDTGGLSASLGTKTIYAAADTASINDAVYMADGIGNIYRFSGDESSWDMSGIMAEYSALGQISSLKLSADGSRLYAVHTESSIVNLFSVNNDGTLTLLDQISSGTAGAEGLAGVTDVVEKDGYLVACGSTNNTLVVFEFTDETKTALKDRHTQYLKSGTGIGEFSNPLALETTADGVRMLVQGEAEASIIELALDATPESVYDDLEVGYSGIDNIAVLTGIGEDTVDIYESTAGNILVETGDNEDTVSVYSAGASAGITIKTGHGNDFVNIFGADAGTDFAIYTGSGEDTVTAEVIGGISYIFTEDDNDTVNLERILAESTVSLWTGDGNDTITIGYVESGTADNKTGLVVDAGIGDDLITLEGIGENANATLQGGVDDDTLETYSSGIATGAGVFFYGNTQPYHMLTEMGDDRLHYYGAHAGGEGVPNGSINNGSSLVNYYTFDDVRFYSEELTAGFFVVGSESYYEGDALTLSADSSHIPNQTGLKYEWNLSGNEGFDFETAESTISIAWASLAAYGIVDDGQYNVRMRVSAGGNEEEVERTLNIKDKKRQLLLSGSESVQEDNVYTLTLDKNDASEPGSDTVTGWTVDWGDGTVDSYDPTATDVTHIYNDAGNYTVTGIAADEDGEAVATKGVAVTADIREHIQIINTAGQQIDEGSEYTLSLKSERPQSGSGLWRVEWGDGESSVVNSSNTLNQIDLKHVYADAAAGGTDYTIGVSLLDNEGRFEESYTLRVNSVDPTVSLEGVDTLIEGEEYTLTIKEPVDPGEDTIRRYIIDWGDGGKVEDLLIEFDDQDYVLTHLYADAAVAGENVTIRVAAVDEDGTYNDVGTKSFTLTNQVPDVSFDKAGGSITIDEGSTVKITDISYTDQGDDAVIGWEVDWGDGSVGLYTAAEMNDMVYGLEHTYKIDGVYDITLSAWDGEDYTADAPVEASKYRVEVKNIVSTGADWEQPVASMSSSSSTASEGEEYNLVVNGYDYDFQNDVSIDDVLISWGDGSSQTLTYSEFRSLADGESIVVAHTYEREGVMNITLAFKDKEFVVGALSSTTAISEIGAGTDPSTTTGAVLIGGVPYYNSEKMLIGYGTLLTPGFVSKDVNGSVVTVYHDIVDDNGVYKLKEYIAEELVKSYDNTASFNVLVQDVAPHIELSGDNTAMKGRDYTLKFGDIIDASGDMVTQYIIDWGDGNSQQIVADDIGGAGSLNTAHTVKHTYAAEGDFNIEISSIVSDGKNYSSNISNILGVTVETVPMDMELIGTQHVGELGEYTLTLGAINDPSQPGVTVIPDKWIVDWGDGNIEEILNTDSSAVKETKHSYNATSGFTFNLSVDFEVDSDSYAATEAHNVTIVNNVPLVTLDSSETSIDEGGTFTGDYSFEDNGSDTSWTVRVDYGDGSNIEERSITDKTFSLEHVFADDGEYAVKVNVLDSRGGESEQVVTAVSVSNVAPTVALTGNASVGEGSEYSLTIGSPVDPGSDSIMEYRIDWGDGSEIESIFAIDLEDAGWVLTHTFADNIKDSSGNNMGAVIKVSVVDEDGVHLDVATKSVMVEDVAPSAALSGADAVAEGSEYELTIGNVVDSGSDIVIDYIIDWGDGSSETVSAVQLAGSSGVAKHTYSNNRSAQIRLSIRDEDGTHSDVTIKDITVTDVTPVMELVGADSVAEGTEYVLYIGGVTDPGDDTVESYTVDWGDGTSVLVSAAEMEAAQNSLKHTYADNGAVEIKVDIKDDDGTHSNVATKSVTVNNVAPVITLNGDNAVVQDVEYTLTVGDVVDLGEDTVSSYIVNWGDSNIDTIAAVDFPADRLLKHAYDNHGSYSIKISLVDEDGTHSDIVNKGLIVTDSPPKATISGNDSVDEGSIYSLKIGDVIDSGNDSVVNYIIDWGEGSGAQVIAVADLPVDRVVTHTFADDGSYNIKLSIEDDSQTHADVATKSVVASNVIPVAEISGAGSVAEGSPYELTIAAVTDPGADTITEYKVDWGDGSGVQVVAAADLPVDRKLTHTYSDNGYYQIAATMSDEDVTDVAVGSMQVTVTNVAPDAELSGEVTIVEGGVYELAIGEVVDAGDDTVDSYVIVWGDGTSVTFSAGSMPADRKLTHTYTDNGNYWIGIGLYDEDGLHPYVSFIGVAVTNVAPSLALSGAAEVLEGSPYSLNFAEPVDPGDDTVSWYAIDWGDGSDIQYVHASYMDYYQREVTHVYADNGNYQIGVGVMDEDGGYSYISTQDVQVNDVAPEVALIGSAAQYEGMLYELFVGEVSDVGTDIVESYTVDWGDGTTDTLTAEQISNASRVISHIYADDGVYTISMQITDEDGTHANTETKNIQIVNLGPYLTLGGEHVIDEGSEYTLSLSDVFDLGDDTVEEYIIDWGDGSNAQVVSAADLPIGRTVAHTYNDNGHFQVKVSVKDEDGLYSNIAGLDVIVKNVVPVAELSGDVTVHEGSEYELNVGVVDDVSADTVSHYVIDWGDGGDRTIMSAAELEAIGRKLTHKYADNGDYTIVLGLYDEDGQHPAVKTKSVSVTDVAPTLSLEGIDQIAEGDEYSLNIGDIIDPGNDTVTSYHINWGDGEVTEVSAFDPEFTNNRVIKHVYTDDGDTVISIQVEDEDGTYSDIATKSISIFNTPPRAVLYLDGDLTEGSELEVAVSNIIEPGDDTVTSYLIDWGDGLDTGFINWGEGNANDRMTAQDLQMLSSLHTHTYIDNGDYLISMILVDEDDTFEYFDYIIVNIENVAPSLSLSGEDSILEGSEYSLTLGMVSDVGNDSVSRYDIDWGDGGGVESITAADLDSAGRVWKHDYIDNGEYEIKVILTDEEGTYSDESEVITKSVSVSNDTPSAVISGVDALDEGGTFALTVGNVSDAGDDTIDSYDIDWGDGSTVQEISAADMAAAGRVIQHQYADNGEYTVILSIVDEDGTYQNVSSKNVSVNNVEPVVLVSGEDTTVEGVEYSLNIGSIVDSGTDTISEYIIDWGDGNIEQVTAIIVDQNNGVLKHRYDDNGSYVINLSLVDEDGIYENVAVKNVDISNVSPVISFDDSALSIFETQRFTKVLDLIDNSTTDNLEVSIDYGDGNSEVLDMGTVRNIVLQNAYQVEGEYTVTLKVRDDDGGESAEYSFIVTVSVQIIRTSDPAQFGIFEDNDGGILGGEPDGKANGFVEPELELIGDPRGDTAETGGEEEGNILEGIKASDEEGSYGIDEGPVSGGEVEVRTDGSAGLAKESLFGITSGQRTRMIEIKDITQGASVGETTSSENSSPETSGRKVQGDTFNDLNGDGIVQKSEKHIVELSVSGDKGSVDNVYSSANLIQQIRSLVTAEDELVARALHDDGLDGEGAVPVSLEMIEDR